MTPIIDRCQCAVLVILLSSVVCISAEEWRTPLEEISASHNFMFGVASSAYQVEGGWNQDGKGEQIWDKYVHSHPERIMDGSTGDVACDSYNNLDRDINMLVELGVDFYRFSISWSRVLPMGFRNVVNDKGVAYYRRLLDRLEQNNIMPMVTLYHWDLPQPLQDLGGWANDVVVDYFEDYATVMFDLFADRVPIWVTINEPWQICHFGYGGNQYAPYEVQPGIGEYLCVHNVLKAHARAYHLYKDKYQAKYGGKVGLVGSFIWGEPMTNSTEDIAAANRANLMDLGWQTHAVYSPLGDYPEVMKETIALRSKQQGFSRSRLPEFTRAEVEYIRGTYDFLGVNYYTSRFVKAVRRPASKKPTWEDDLGADLIDRTTGLTAVPWLKVYPEGLAKVLRFVKTLYQNPLVYITENGCGGEGGLNDVTTVDYYKEHIAVVLKAVLEDGCDIRGYTSWSLMDSFEWESGYTNFFGLYRSNFSDPLRQTELRASGKYYQFILNQAKTIRRENNNKVGPVFEPSIKDGASENFEQRFIAMFVVLGVSLVLLAS